MWCPKGLLNCLHFFFLHSGLWQWFLPLSRAHWFVLLPHLFCYWLLLMYFSFQLLYSSTLWLFFIFSLCWKLIVTSQSASILFPSFWNIFMIITSNCFSRRFFYFHSSSFFFFSFLRSFIFLLRLEHSPFLSVVRYISWPWRSVPAVHSPLIMQGQGPAVPRVGSDLSLQTQFCRLQDHSFVSGACPLVGGAGSGGWGCAKGPV